MFLDKSQNIKKTIYFSFLAQVVTTFIASQGLTINLDERDSILKDILKMELFVQIIETTFYVWVILALKNYNILTRRRYIDWVITTPTMLVSTIIFMRYIEYKEKNKEIPDFWKIIDEEKGAILQIIIYNFFMLAFGYLGESQLIDKTLSIGIGFIFFCLSFNKLYEYAKETETGMNLYKFLVSVWSLYGVSAMLNNTTKNICYNLLDIVSKKFYGLYIYYIMSTLELKDGK